MSFGTGCLSFFGGLPPLCGVQKSLFYKSIFFSAPLPVVVFILMHSEQRSLWGLLTDQYLQPREMIVSLWWMWYRGSVFKFQSVLPNLSPLNFIPGSATAYARAFIGGWSVDLDGVQAQYSVPKQLSHLILCRSNWLKFDSNLLIFYQLTK